MDVKNVGIVLQRTNRPHRRLQRSSDRFPTILRWGFVCAFVVIAQACGGTSTNGGGSHVTCGTDGDCINIGGHCNEGLCRSTVVTTERDAGATPGDAGHAHDENSLPDGAPIHETETGVECPADFPTFDRSCTDDSNCTLVTYQTDCCGSQAILAINRAEKGRFGSSAAACQARFPICGCPGSFNAPLDDGTTAGQLSEALATCLQGQCRSKFNPDTGICGQYKCSGSQYCSAVEVVAGIESFNCTENAACAGTCNQNPCVTAGCSCREVQGHVTIGCPSFSGTPSTCNERTDLATQIVEAAFAVAIADRSCTTDADCTIASGASNCTNSCGHNIVSTDGAKTIQAAIDGIDAGVCADFVSQGCTLVEPPCSSPLIGAACNWGQCSDFPPATWTSFVVDERRGADSTSSSTPPSCLPGHACTLWTITPDGTISKSTNGTPSSAKLSTTDFATLDGILRSVEFRRIYNNVPIGCDPAPTGVRVSVVLVNQYGALGLDQTGCALVGPPDNDVMRLYDLVRAY